MGKKARKPAVSALCAAIAAVMIIAGSLLPTGRVALAAVAGLATAAALIECGYMYSILEFVVAAGLGMLLSPSKTGALMFCVLFGWYPIVKSLLERIPNRTVEYVLKFFVIAAVFAAVYLLSRLGIGDINLPRIQIFLTAVVAVIGFFAYDICLSGLIRIYIRRVRERK